MLRSLNLHAMIFLAALLPVCTIPVYSLAIPSPQIPVYADQYLVRRQNGNPNVAGDLYGIGLRVGAYLQILGMLLSCLRKTHRSRVGITLLSSSVCLSLFTAWTILVAGNSISPCEAWLILSLTFAYGTPKFAAFNESQKLRGGIGTVCCAISAIWLEISFLWFFATLYRTLPGLGTNNLVWFFAPVNISGWFRIFMLVVSCIKCMWLPFQLVGYIDMLSAIFKVWTDDASDYGSDDGDDRSPIPPYRLEQFSKTLTNHLSPSLVWIEQFWKASMKGLSDCLSTLCQHPWFRGIVDFQNKIFDWWIELKKEEILPNGEATPEGKMKIIIWRLRLRIFNSLWGLAVLVLTIAGVEKTIQYNDLLPTNELARPGQIIPFILGIVTAAEGVSKAFRPYKPRETGPEIQMVQWESEDENVVDSGTQTQGKDEATMGND